MDFIGHTLPFWLVVMLSFGGAIGLDLLHKQAIKWRTHTTARLTEAALVAFLVLELIPLIVHAAQPAIAAVRCMLGL
jgi:hypothetical protein